MNRILARLICELSPGWHPGFNSLQVIGALADHIYQLYTASTFERWYVQLSLNVVQPRAGYPIRFYTRPRCIRCGQKEIG